jgi:prepilin-type N-terminal cleavage/methylation domain-containing protein/prepilin-type processing-associated H-X9-DG protein
MTRRWASRGRAFTLIELLVVIGIIAVVLAMLLPALAGVRRSAQAVQCSSNLRQIVQSLTMYAGEFNGAFPPNSIEIDQYWFSEWTLGRYIKSKAPLMDGSIGGGVLICPTDEEPVVRSYSMNTYASSYVSSFVRDSLDGPNPRAKRFKAGVGESSKIILMIETFSSNEAPVPPAPLVGYASYPIIGWIGARPAQRFGAAGGAWADPAEMVVDFGRWGPGDCQVNYARHRNSGRRAALYGTAIGRTNIGFADGHVELLRHDELADFSSGTSTYRAMWSPLDRQADSY